MSFIPREWPGRVYRLQHPHEIITPPKDFLDACSSGDLLSLIALLGDGRKTITTRAPPTDLMLQKAAMNNHVEIVEYLLEWDPLVIIDYHLLYRAASNHHVETYKFLHSKYPEIIHWTFHTYGDAVVTAASTNNATLLRFLLEHGANPGRGPRPNLMMGRFSALDMAVSRSSEEAVGLLIKHGVEVSSSRGIQTAAANGDFNIVRMLLAAGDDINRILVPYIPLHQAQGMGTSLHEAVKGGHLNIVQYLLDNNADQNVRDVDRKTPIALAREILIGEKFEPTMGKPRDPAFPLRIRDIVGLLEAHAEANWRLKDREIWRSLQADGFLQKRKPRQRSLNGMT